MNKISQYLGFALELAEVIPSIVALVASGDLSATGLQSIINREIATSPFAANVMRNFIRSELQAYAQHAETETSLETFVGDKVPDAEVKAFQAANPWAKTREAALAGIKVVRLQKENADLKAGKPAEAAAAKKAGEKEAIIRAKARGTLRPVTGKNARPGAAGDLKKGVNLADPDERAAAAAKFIERRRASGVVD